MLERSGDKQDYKDNQACSQQRYIDKVGDEFVMKRYDFKL